MIFNETKLTGAFVIELEQRSDDRGFFSRTFCRREFQEHGLNAHIAQCNISFNRLMGTMRGMHYQLPPNAEAKLVRCTMGSIYDVIVDLRQDSRTCGQWIAVELTARNRRILYIPEGFAHGFQTLADNTEVFYQISDFYCAESARGMRWNDPTFKIDWPLPVSSISDRDRMFPDFHFPRE